MEADPAHAPNRGLRLGFVSTPEYDADAVGSWSGTPFHMARALACAGVEVVPLRVRVSKNRGMRLVRFISRRLVCGRVYMRDRAPEFLRQLAREVARRAHEASVDAILSPSTLPVAWLDGRVPVHIWSDALFGSVVDQHPAFRRLSARTLREGFDADSRACRRAARLFFCSRWARDGATSNHHLDPSKAVVVPFGANIGTPPPLPQVEGAVIARGRRPPRLLFVGVDWLEKGGPATVRIVAALREQGIPAKLDVVGCEPPPLGTAEPWITRHGFIPKTTAENRARLDALYQGATWLVVPTRFDCFGVVFAEAAAHGLPSLAPDLGGIAASVAEGENGFRLPASATPEIWAGMIASIPPASMRYRELCLRSRRRFDHELNWPAAGAAVVREILACHP